MAPLSPSGSASAFRTSPSLLLRVQDNDQGAWTRLVNLYAPLVYHWCGKAQLNADDMADVFQETFRAVARNIREFRRDRAGDSFRGWLRTITQNKIRDHFRRQEHEPRAAGGRAGVINRWRTDTQGRHHECHRMPRSRRA
jgi:RNA polymerase sigma-70 factor (ECF subfamily)